MRYKEFLNVYQICFRSGTNQKILRNIGTKHFSLNKTHRQKRVGGGSVIDSQTFSENHCFAGQDGEFHEEIKPQTDRYTK